MKPIYSLSLSLSLIKDIVMLKKYLLQLIKYNMNSNETTTENNLNFTSNYYHMLVSHAIPLSQQTDYCLMCVERAELTMNLGWGEDHPILFWSVAT